MGLDAVVKTSTAQPPEAGKHINLEVDLAPQSAMPTLSIWVARPAGCVASGNVILFCGASSHN